MHIQKGVKVPSGTIRSRVAEERVKVKGEKKTLDGASVEHRKGGALNNLYVLEMGVVVEIKRGHPLVEKKESRLLNMREYAGHKKQSHTRGDSRRNSFSQGEPFPTGPPARSKDLQKLTSADGWVGWFTSLTHVKPLRRGSKIRLTGDNTPRPLTANPRCKGGPREKTLTRGKGSNVGKKSCAPQLWVVNHGGVWVWGGKLCWCARNQCCGGGGGGVKSQKAQWGWGKVQWCGKPKRTCGGGGRDQSLSVGFGTSPAQATRYH